MTSFEYDGADAVVESTVDSIRKLHLYSASDERVASLTVDAADRELSSEWTIRDLSARVLRRYSRSGGTWTWQQDYVYRDGQLLASEIPGPERTLHYHPDHLGTPRLITNYAAAEVSRHTYYAFGIEATPPPTPGIHRERLQFTGHERDASSLDYMHARYYNPQWGRFLSVDPGPADLRRPQTWNRYVYAENNPVLRVDPDGRLSNPSRANKEKASRSFIEAEDMVRSAS